MICWKTSLLRRQARRDAYMLAAVLMDGASSCCCVLAGELPPPLHAPVHATPNHMRLDLWCACATHVCVGRCMSHLQPALTMRGCFWSSIMCYFYPQCGFHTHHILCVLCSKWCWLARHERHKVLLRQDGLVHQSQRQD